MITPSCPECQTLYAQVSNTIGQKPELGSYVKRLEENYGKGEHQISEPLEENIVKEMGDFSSKRIDEK